MNTQFHCYINTTPESGKLYKELWGSQLSGVGTTMVRRDGDV